MDLILLFIVLPMVWCCKISFFFQVMKFKKLSENAKAPVRLGGAAGFDLFSAVSTEIHSESCGVVRTDIAIELPPETYGRIAPRSGLALSFLTVGGGVIDRDFRGGIKVILYNHSKRNFYVKKGDRIAQLIVERICLPELEESETLSETSRGKNGFGSSGGYA